MSRKRHEGDWPETSSPTRPPKAVLYYGRMIGGVMQDVQAHPFAETWQLGVFLNQLVENVDDFEMTHPNEGYQANYTVRSPEGYLLNYRVKTFMIDVASAMELGKQRGVPVPWEIDNMLRSLTGRHRMGYHEWSGTEVVKPVARVARELGERVPRASRDGKITLDMLCEGTSWDPGKVRAALRKKGVEKPAGGWVFEEGDEKLDIVRGIVGK